MKSPSSLLACAVIVVLALCLTGCRRASLANQDQWDLVYISDSTGWGVARKFAANIERDTGKTVVVHNYATGNLSVLQVLSALRGGPDAEDGPLPSDQLRTDIADAEVVVFYGNPRGDAAQGGVTGGLETCMNKTVAPDDCTPAHYAPYVENLKAAYEEILALRDGKPTIIRAVDFYNPLISRHRTDGTEAECTACWEVFNAAVKEAADAYHVPLVSTYDAFNGPQHDEDPREKGYILSDGQHATPEGQQVIADALSAAGYDSIAP
jgi:hypothetical protein